MTRVLKLILRGGAYIALVLCFMAVVAQSHRVLAIKYDLIAPTGTLTRGQDVTFTVNVDTEGQPLSTAQVGLTYTTDVLQYSSTAAGNTFTTVTGTPGTSGNLTINASSSTAFNGSGTFATVTFKLIADSAGSTTLCTLTSPTTAPTTAPTVPTSTTSAQPTRLPTTGDSDNVFRGLSVGGVFILIALALLWFNSSERRTKPSRRRN